MLPGVGAPRLLWINTLDLLGLDEPKRQAITLISNCHLSLENYQYRRMRNAYAHDDAHDALVNAAKDTSADSGPGPAPYSDRAAREVISRESNALADATDRVLEQSLPRKYVSDPAYVLGETEPDLDLFDVLNKSLPPAREAMTGMVAGLLRNFGAHSCVHCLQGRSRARAGRVASVRHVAALGNSGAAHS